MFIRPFYLCADLLHRLRLMDDSLVSQERLSDLLAYSFFQPITVDKCIVVPDTLSWYSCNVLAGLCYENERAAQQCDRSVGRSNASTVLNSNPVRGSVANPARRTRLAFG